MNFVINHASGAGSFARPVGQQSSTLPLYHRCHPMYIQFSTSQKYGNHLCANTNTFTGIYTGFKTSNEHRSVYFIAHFAKQAGFKCSERKTVVLLQDKPTHRFYDPEHIGFCQPIQLFSIDILRENLHQVVLSSDLLNWF